MNNCILEQRYSRQLLLNRPVLNLGNNAIQQTGLLLTFFFSYDKQEENTLLYVTYHLGNRIFVASASSSHTELSVYLLRFCHRGP